MRYHVTLRSRTYIIDVAGGSVTVDPGCQNGTAFVLSLPAAPDKPGSV